METGRERTDGTPTAKEDGREQARKAFIPGPAANTYPEGGSEDQDYYGFTGGMSSLWS